MSITFSVPSLCRNKKYDIQFVLDGSRSIHPIDFNKKRKLLRDVFFLLDLPSSDINIGLLQFSTVKDTEEIIRLEKYSYNDLIEAIEKMEYHAGRRTMLGHALNEVNRKVCGNKY